MRDVLELVERVASTDTTVLLTGESGTGKEVLARLIHERSRRREAPFVGVNCGALPESVLESELFGHVRGAFTGAVADKRGLFEEAHRGTLFLDEVGEMPPAIQVKLLRALQEREIRRVGATKSVKVDARIVAASNRNLEEAVNRGDFRRDLYYRLNVITVRLPPLRERREDIVPLAQFFLRRHARAQGKKIGAISGEALERLVAHPWLGNVRELENVIERAVVLTTRDRITVAELPAALQALPSSERVDIGAPLPLAELEKRSILAALERNQGNRTRTAKQLQISGHTLWRKLKAYGIGRS
jgi:transcriptional regulator with PAS, ATPase and Fis domain